MQVVSQEATIQRKLKFYCLIRNSECMNPYNRKWYSFNDDYVRETSVTEDKYNGKGASSPYVLFYVKTSCLS